MPANNFKSSSSAVIFGVLITLFLPLELLGDENGGTWRVLYQKALAEKNYSRALDYLERIKSQQPDNPRIREAKINTLLKLAQQLYEEKKHDQAQDVLLEVLDLAPANISALKMLGYIAYYSQDLHSARDYWQLALTRSPADQQLADQLRRLEGEIKVEQDMDVSHLGNFDIRFHAGRPDYHIYDIQGYLLEAHQEIGYDFNYYPSRVIVVILYTQAEFERLRRTPQWVGALYDGKIRLPVKRGGLSAVVLKKILWHEYTHALINDLANNNCPRWLHEGLAQYQEAKNDPVDLGALQRAGEKGTLIRLTTLDRAFNYANHPEKVKLAYAQAYSFTEYLIQRYGFWMINRLLRQLKKNKQWKSVLEEEFLLPLSTLENNWRNTLALEFSK